MNASRALSGWLESAAARLDEQIARQHQRVIDEEAKIAARRAAEAAGPGPEPEAEAG
jgi:hypothetical protein